MRKGGVFLLAAVALAAVTVYYLSYHYERPAPPAPPVAVAPIACGTDTACFVSAVRGGCAQATFTLLGPSNGLALEGRIAGLVLGKCEVIVSGGNDSMTCMFDSSFSAIGSIEELRTACSGSLLDRLAG